MKKEKDSAVKRFLENPAHFCDLFNGSLFGGKQVLKAGQPGEPARGSDCQLCG